MYHGLNTAETGTSETFEMAIRKTHPTLVAGRGIQIMILNLPSSDNAAHCDSMV